MASRLLDHVYSDTYHAGMQSSARRYLRSCAAVDMPPWPVTFDSMACYLMASKYYIDKKASSIVTDATTLKAFCRVHDIPFMTNARDLHRHSQLLAAVRVVEDRPTKRPTPLTIDIMVGIANAVDWSDINERQLWVQMLLSHDCMLRAGTTCGSALRTEHLHFEEDGRVRVDLHKIKHGRRVVDAAPVWLSPAKDILGVDPELQRRFDTATLLTRYLLDTNIFFFPAAPVFALLDFAGKVVLPFVPQSYANWLAHFKRLCAAGGADPSTTAQAARAGGLTDAVEAGVPIALAIAVGRWASERSARPYLRPARRAGVAVRAAFSAQLQAAASTPPV